MGWWQVSADTLATSRFVISPLAETQACLIALHRSTVGDPASRAWLDAHQPAYNAQLASDPVTASLVRATIRRGWIADFLTPAPLGAGDVDFASELAVVSGDKPGEGPRRRDRDAARTHPGRAGPG